MIETKRNKYKIISKRIRQLMLRSSAHGVPRFVKSTNLLIKLVWLSVLIASTTLGTFYVIKNIIDYLKYETTTTISLIDEPETEFPTVSFCLSNNFSQPLNQTILTLKFNNIRRLDYDQLFEPFNDSFYGKCYRFNSGKNMYGENVSILKVTQHGTDYGLKLEMNITLENNDYTELIVSIHNKSSPPLDFNQVEHFISTGAWNYFEIQRVLYESLEYPYNDCLKDVQEFKLNKTIINYFSKLNYSKNDCLMKCSFLHALEFSNCSCNATLETFQRNCQYQWYEKDNNNTIINCVNNYLAEFQNQVYKGCMDYCPTECDRLDYFINTHLEVVPITKGNISTETRSEPSLKLFETYENVQKGYICFYVYFDHIKFTLISQIPKTEIFSLISSIGGILGFFLGISFLSFIEIIEIMVETILILIDKY